MAGTERFPLSLARLVPLALCLLLMAAPLWAADTHCPPLGPPPAGDEVISLTPADASSLPSIVGSADPFTTILLADGVYSIQSIINFNSSHVTLRSVSGNRDAVIIDAEYRTSASKGVLIDVDHITVADLTLKRVWFHPVHVVGGGDYAMLYNLRIVDGRQQFVKVNQTSGATPTYADHGTAACNELELTPAGREFLHDNPTDPFGCYTGGFDIHQTWDWVIRDNTIKSIHCTNGGLAEHAIHFFQSNRDPIVERNMIVDNARGIGFGLGAGSMRRTYPDDPFEGTEMEGREDEVMQIGGVIRNNFIYADIGQFYDSGINLESSWKPQVLHNTIYSEEGSFNSAIDVRFAGSVNVLLANNLYSPRITARNDAPAPTQQGNVLASSNMFVDLTAGDLHLLGTASAAIDQGSDVGVTDDFDGNERDASPDTGADEHVDSNSAPIVSVTSPVPALTI